MGPEAAGDLPGRSVVEDHVRGEHLFDHGPKTWTQTVKVSEWPRTVPVTRQQPGVLHPRNFVPTPPVGPGSAGRTPVGGSRTHNASLPYQSRTQGTGSTVGSIGGGGVTVGPLRVTAQVGGGCAVSHGCRAAVACGERGEGAAVGTLA